MTNIDVITALDLVSMREGNSGLADLIFQNISSILLDLKTPTAELVSSTIRLYVWAWLMIGYSLGKETSKTHAYQITEKEIMPVYKKVFRNLDKYDESLLVPIDEQLEKMDALYINNGAISLLRNMIAIVAAWLCEAGMVIARKPHILKLELHYTE